MDIPSYLMGAIKGAHDAGIKYVVVQELPTTGEEGIIYLVPKSTSKTNNIYDEYMYISNNWELIGDTEADLSNYLAKDNTTAFTPSGDYNPATKKYVDDNVEIIQYSTVPTASATNEGKIIQYTGITTNDYTNGYFYECVEDNNVYSWENINVQDAGGFLQYKFSAKIDTYPWGQGSSPTVTNYNTQDNINLFKELSALNYNEMPIGNIKLENTNYNDKGLLIATEIIKDYSWNIPLAIRFRQIKPTVGYDAYGIPYRYFYEFLLFGQIESGSSEITSVNYQIYSYKNILVGANNNALGIANTTSYTPTGDYNPATKKYVDDTVSSAIGTALQGNY